MTNYYAFIGFSIILATVVFKNKIPKFLKHDMSSKKCQSILSDFMADNLIFKKEKDVLNRWEKLTNGLIENKITNDEWYLIK